MIEYEIYMREKERFFKIIRNIGDYQNIYHLHGSFGDIYMQCACVKETLKENDKIVVICETRYVKLVKQAIGKNITHYVEADGGFINRILNDEKIIGKSNVFPIRMLPTLYPMITECIIKEKLQYIDFIRTLLNNDEKKGSLPKIENDYSKALAKEYLIENRIEIGRTVIISADNNTQEELSDEFWNQFIKIAENWNYKIVINSSGTIIKAAQKLMNTSYQKISIPPELVVSIAEVSGIYASGNNGYATIQALFNTKKGFHFIKKPNQDEAILRDKFNNEINLNQFYHKNAFKGEFLNMQEEIQVDDKESNNNFKIINKIFEEIK